MPDDFLTDLRGRIANAKANHLPHHGPEAALVIAVSDAEKIAALIEACEGMGPYGATGSGHAEMVARLADLNDREVLTVETP